TKLIDDYAQLLAKPDKSDDEKQLLDISRAGADTTVSSIPFSHLVDSYQAALKDPDKTLEILMRTEYKDAASSQAEIIKKELAFIDNWLNKWAPLDVKFELLKKVDPAEFNDSEKQYLTALSQKIAEAPADADGEWFHKAIYE